MAKNTKRITKTQIVNPKNHVQVSKTPKAVSREFSSRAVTAFGTAMPLVTNSPRQIDAPFGIGDFNIEPSTLISQVSVRNRLLAVFGPFMGGGPAAKPRITVSDIQYVSCPIRFIRGIAMAEPMLTPGAYRAEVFDCDDYVQYLKVKVSLYAAYRGFTAAPAVGFLLTELHAFNFCLDPDGRLYILNTQSDQREVESDPMLLEQFLGLVNENGDRIANRIECIYV